MAIMDTPKFKVGEAVKFTDDLDIEAGKVIEINYNSSVGFSYKISASYYDPDQHKMIDGFKNCLESELVLVSTEKEVSNA